MNTVSLLSLMSVFLTHNVMSIFKVIDHQPTAIAERPAMAVAYTRRTARPQAGDLLFYPPDSGSLLGRLVAWWTHGPFCHVAIAISPDECVQALSGGIVRSPIALGYTLARTGSHLPDADREEALAWLIKQVGNHYGYADIFDDFLKPFLARLFPHHGLFLVEEHALDCSDLAAQFLAHADYPLLDLDALDTPQTISPNDLARLLRVA